MRTILNAVQETNTSNHDWYFYLHPGDMSSLYVQRQFATLFSSLKNLTQEVFNSTYIFFNNLECTLMSFFRLGYFCNNFVFTNNICSTRKLINIYIKSKDVLSSLLYYLISLRIRFRRHYLYLKALGIILYRHIYVGI